MAEAVVMIILEIILILSLPFLSRALEIVGGIVILILYLAVSNAVALVHR